MKSFDELSARGQVQRLRPVAEAIIKAYGFEAAVFSKIRHWQNTTFRVDVPIQSGSWRITDRIVPGRYLLRISRPQDRKASQVEGELAWLNALNTETDLTVPKPLGTTNGESGVTILNKDHQGLDGDENTTRVGVMLHWMPGRMAGNSSRTLKHISLLGRSMAKLHRHASQWREGLKLDRWHWDCDAIMGHDEKVGIEPDVWEELPPEEFDLHSECEARLRTAVKALGHGKEVHGIIHADLHFANVLFAGGEARPIDFDDCGPGHYLYDMASTLMGFDSESGQTQWRDAFLTGYREIRPLKNEHLEFLNAFIAARESTLILWCRSSARTREVFRDALPRWRKRSLPEIRRRLEVINSH